MNLQQIEQAAGRIKSVIHQTPVDFSRTFSDMTGAQIYLKCENLQKTGSFKVRGAYNKIARMAGEGAVPELIASSAGNHAQGVAYAAKMVGAKATIVMPRSAALAKVSATEGYGAEVVLHGDGFDEAYDHARELQQERGAEFVHAFNDEDIIAGQGTISLEILSALPTVNTVLVPAGGGGLLAGMAACIKQVNPNVRVVGVQAAGADAIVQSYRAGEVVESASAVTIADGIAIKRPGELTTELIRNYVDDMVTVPDDRIAEAILLLLERTKMVVEPAGATALAAALAGKVEIAGKRVVCVLSGGNIDVGMIQKIVERGLVTRGRQMMLQAVIIDVPGSLERFSHTAAESGVNIISVQHDRLSPDLQLGEAILHVACEVSGPAHGKEFIARLKQTGHRVKFD